MRKVELTLHSPHAYYLTAKGNLYVERAPESDPPGVVPFEIRNTRSRSFRDLRPGKYVFRFDVINDHGEFTITAFVWTQDGRPMSQSKQFDTTKDGRENLLFQFEVEP